jgi:F0F1-type ATP synthase membrane subunit b/b'
MEAKVIIVIALAIIILIIFIWIVVSYVWPALQQGIPHVP